MTLATIVGYAAGIAAVILGAGIAVFVVRETRRLRSTSDTRAVGTAALPTGRHVSYEHAPQWPGEYGPRHEVDQSLLENVTMWVGRP